MKDNFTEREQKIAILFAEYIFDQRIIRTNGWCKSVHGQLEYHLPEHFFKEFEQHRASIAKSLEI